MRLQRNDQEKKVDELVEKWLPKGAKQLPRTSRSPAAARSRLEAAVNYALGHVGPWWTYRIEEKWIEPLAQTVRVLARHKDQQYAANSIMQHQHFRDRDQAKQLRKEFAELLVAEAATLPPERIYQIVGWIAHNNPIVESETWKKIAAALEKRWAMKKKSATGGSSRRRWCKSMAAISARRSCWHFWSGSSRKDRRKIGRRTCSSCSTRCWRSRGSRSTRTAPMPFEGDRRAGEERCSGAELDAEAKEARRFYTIVAKLDALHRLNDRMVTARYEATMAAVEHQEKLTRTELATKRKDALREARVAVADRLKRDREAVWQRT